MARQPADLDPEEFRSLGHRAVDRLADFYAQLPTLPVGPDTTVEQIRALLEEIPFPDEGTAPEALIDEAMDLLVPNSVYNGHPRFYGFITPSAAPMGAIAELLAAGLNQNVASFLMAPMASEIELQSIRWMAELIGYPSDCGGILVSGGTEASFIALHVAREVKCPWDVRAGGLIEGPSRLVVYTSAEGHNWVETAVEMFGLGTDSLRWIPADDDARMDVGALRAAIEEDRSRGHVPLMVVGTAGTTSTASIDPLARIRDICREFDIWFHVDGAYGAYGAMLDDHRGAFEGMTDADSLALDPHKWLYIPIEAGCCMVRDRKALKRTFTRPMPAYYRIKLRTGEHSSETVNLIQHGPQATRGFRALKLWLALRHVGRAGYVSMLSENVRLAALTYRLATERPGLEALTHNLSICTFRYVPEELEGKEDESLEYLNLLNAEVVSRIRAGGEAFITPGRVGKQTTLRVALVNFRTTEEDIKALMDQVQRVGAELHSAHAGAVPERDARQASVVAEAPDEGPSAADLLSVASAFERLPRQVLVFLAERAVRAEHPLGSELMREGEVSNALHVVVAGRVRVERGVSEEERMVLAQLGPGDLVGEMGVLDDEPRFATVVAVEDTVTLEVPAGAMRDALERFPQVAAAILPTLTRRARAYARAHA